MNYYQVLGVSQHASLLEMREAYHEKAKKYHPDYGGGNAELFSGVSVAYKTLSDPRRAKIYRESLEFDHRDCLVCNGQGHRYRQQGFNKRIAVPCMSCNGNGIISKG